MPIKFRCDYCKQLLGIAHSKAGSLVDCPTCGRTLRVPNVDGTVDPPPTPGLNLDDDGLRRALDELAQLGSPPKDSEFPTDARPAGQASAPSAASSSKPVESEPFPANPVIDVTLDRPVAASNAIALEPLPPMVVVAPPVAPGGPVGSPLPATNVPLSGESPESILAGLASPILVPRSVPIPAVSRAPGVAWKWIYLASLISGLIGLAVGFGLGRLSADRSHPAVSEVVQPAAAPHAAAGPLAIHGRITFRNSQGHVEPDAGAIVIALPTATEGTVKLKSIGLRPNDDEADRQIAVEALQAAGGRLAVAATDGAYHLDVPQAGDYQIIVLSRFHGRADEPAAPDRKSVLEEHFERPEQLTGKSNYTMTKIQHQGQGPVVWDHLFAD